MLRLIGVTAAMLRVALLDPTSGAGGQSSGGQGGNDGSGQGGSGSGGSGGGSTNGGQGQGQGDWRGWQPAQDPPGAVRNPDGYYTALESYKDRVRDLERRLEASESSRASEVEAARKAGRAELAPELRKRDARLAILQHAGGRFIDLEDAVGKLEPQASDWLADDGAVDEGKLTAAMDKVLEDKPHWRHPEYKPEGSGDGQGDGQGQNGQGQQQQQQQHAGAPVPNMGGGQRPVTNAQGPVKVDLDAIGGAVTSRTGIKVRATDS